MKPNLMVFANLMKFSNGNPSDGIAKFESIGGRAQGSCNSLFIYVVDLRETAWFTQQKDPTLRKNFSPLEVRTINSFVIFVSGQSIWKMFNNSMVNSNPRYLRKISQHADFLFVSWETIPFTDTNPITLLSREIQKFQNWSASTNSIQYTLRHTYFWDCPAIVRVPKLKIMRILARKSRLETQTFTTCGWLLQGTPQIHETNDW